MSWFSCSKVTRSSGHRGAGVVRDASSSPPETKPSVAGREGLRTDLHCLPWRERQRRHPRRQRLHQGGRTAGQVGRHPVFASIRDGLVTPGKPLSMPPKGGNPSLTDEEIRAVLDYLRSSFGS